MRVLSVLLGVACTAVVLGQALPPGEVSYALSDLGQSGLKPGGSGARGASVFRPSGTRLTFGKIAGVISADAGEKAALVEAFDGVAAGYEEGAKSGGFADEVAGSAAFAICVLDSLADLREIDSAGLMAAIGQMRKVFDTPEVAGATDRHKQEVYEGLLVATALTIVVAQLVAETPGGEENVRRLASSYLESFLGVDSSRVELTSSGLTIRAAERRSAPAGVVQSGSASGLAPGFTFGVPGGFRTADVWYMAEQEGSGGYTGALVRFGPAIPAEGDFNAAVLKAGQQYIPALGGQNWRSPIVYRRRVGNGLLAAYVVARGSEQGRRAETQFTVMLVDCGSHWQPVIMAQTFRSEGSCATFSSVDEGQSYMRWPEVQPLLEAFLATFRCPGGANRAMVTKDDVVGSFSYGSNSQTGWVSTLTGASFTVTAAYAVFYDFRADGTYDYRFQGASGVGAGNISLDRDSGTWRIEGDYVVLDGNKWDRALRVGAVMRQGANKLIAMEDRVGDGPMNIDLAQRLEVYTTR